MIQRPFGHVAACQRRDRQRARATFHGEHWHVVLQCCKTVECQTTPYFDRAVIRRRYENVYNFIVRVMPNAQVGNLLVMLCECLDARERLLREIDFPHFYRSITCSRVHDHFRCAFVVGGENTINGSD